MEVKKIRITNRKQFQLLVTRMEENPHVAKGLKFCEGMQISKQNFSEIWGGLTKGLNSLGPPIRSVTEWQKVWADYKLNIKRKLAHNKKESRATGGGPNKMVILTSCEDAVVKLLSLDKTVDHSGSVFGIPVSQPAQETRPLRSSTPEQTDSNIAQSPMIDIDENQENTENENTAMKNLPPKNLSDLPPKKKTRKQKSEDEEDSRIGMLRKQTDYLKKIAENSSEKARYTRKMYTLHEEHFRNMQNHVLQKEKFKLEELKFKKQLLDYQKQKLELLKKNA